MKTERSMRLFVISLCSMMFLPASVASQQMKTIPTRHVMDISGRFNQPTEVAVGKDGRIFVLDGVNNQVEVFDEKGKYLEAFGGLGGQDGRFRYPVGMDIDARGTIYLADTENHRVQIFDENGGYLRKIDLSPWDALPVDVKADHRLGRIYVTDKRGHQILALKTDGSFEFAWGAFGEDPGNFRFPGMMEMDAKGNLFVVDVLNTRIQKFTPQGKSNGQIGSWGVLPGQLFRPKGIALDEDSNVYVSDSYTGVIQVFDKTGDFKGVLSEDGSGLLRLTTPVGMAFDRKGRLYVVQMALNTVSVFERKGAE